MEVVAASAGSQLLGQRGVPTGNTTPVALTTVAAPDGIVYRRCSPEDVEQLLALYKEGVYDVIARRQLSVGGAGLPAFSGEGAGTVATVAPLPGIYYRMDHGMWIRIGDGAVTQSYGGQRKVHRLLVPGPACALSFASLKKLGGVLSAPGDAASLVWHPVQICVSNPLSATPSVSIVEPREPLYARVLIGRAIRLLDGDSDGSAAWEDAAVSVAVEVPPGAGDTTILHGGIGKEEGEGGDEGKREGGGEDEEEDASASDGPKGCVKVVLPRVCESDKPFPVPISVSVSDSTSVSGSTSTSVPASKVRPADVLHVSLDGPGVDSINEGRVVAAGMQHLLSLVRPKVVVLNNLQMADTAMLLAVCERHVRLQFQLQAMGAPSAPVSGDSGGGIWPMGVDSRVVRRAMMPLMRAAKLEIVDFPDVGGLDSLLHTSRFAVESLTLVNTRSVTTTTLPTMPLMTNLELNGVFLEGVTRDAFPRLMAVSVVLPGEHHCATAPPTLQWLLDSTAVTATVFCLGRFLPTFGYDEATGRLFSNAFQGLKATSKKRCNIVLGPEFARTVPDNPDHMFGTDASAPPLGVPEDIWGNVCVANAGAANAILRCTDWAREKLVEYVQKALTVRLIGAPTDHGGLGRGIGTALSIVRFSFMTSSDYRQLAQNGQLETN